MAITIDATYEDGVLKPDRALPLREHEAVRVTIESRAEQPIKAATDDAGCKLSLGERIAALARDLPSEVLDLLPADGASQHDHYIYGTPKRPERP